MVRNVEYESPLEDLKYCGILLDRCVSCPEVCVYGLCRVLLQGDLIVYRDPIVVYILHIVVFAYFAVPCYYLILYC